MPLEKVTRRWGILKELLSEECDMQMPVRIDPGCSINFEELHLKTDKLGKIPDTRDFLVFKSKNPHTKRMLKTLVCTVKYKGIECR